MPVQHAIWRVDRQPEPLAVAQLDSEQLLEDMIVAAPHLLSDEWMLIGRQEDTGFGGRIDLLAITPDGSLVLIELKRDRTPRDVVAQALDYASWVEQLRPEAIAKVYGRFASGKNLAQEFHRQFGRPLDEDALNQSHQIVIVAESLDASTERIVAYLSERQLPINVVFFRVFQFGDDRLLSRAWLIDPTQAAAGSGGDSSSRPSEPWNGEFYCSFGHGAERSWDDAVEFGFIGAGGGSWYSKTLSLLSAGDRVWVKVPGAGFVGVCWVTGPAQPASQFRVDTPAGDRPVLEVVNRANYSREHVEDPQRCEYFVPVEWLQTVPLDEAIQEVGMFGNQNTICRPTTPAWRWTVERLKERLPGFEGHGPGSLVSADASARAGAP